MILKRHLIWRNTLGKSKSKSKSKLTFYIFLALILGIIAGCIINNVDPNHANILKPIADGFLRMIKMIIAPLLFATLVVGIAGHGDAKGLGKLGLKTIVYFEIVTTIALAIGLFAGNLLQPGCGIDIQATTEQLTQLETMKNVQHGGILAGLIEHMIPTSIVKAMAEGEILQLVFFAVFFAIALGKIGKKGEPILNFLRSLADIMFKFTEYVMNFAPLGVFAAIAHTIGHNGPSVLMGYGKLILTLYGSLIIFVVFVLLVACMIVKIPFMALLNAIKEPATIAFSTASSEAALPKAMEIMENFGVPKNIVGFVMPTGYTFNLDGSTLYLSLAALFVTQMAGIELGLSQQIMIMLALMLTSKGIAAIPRVSLVVLTATLASFNLPVAGIAVLLGIDQILDMGRTTVNLIGNCVATTVVARWENVFDYEKMQRFISESDEEIPVLEAVSVIKESIQETDNEAVLKS